ncbi:MAG TPA: sterol desaturase family protein [Rhodanobacteraceae bacterium]|jgi:sterol desaturase/sphingolipid hydroxylase (fatty acid hydroxylase superfamily)|nr:sterol desaturase family protein [Rhodanobacteraceae bacterium]
MTIPIQRTGDAADPSRAGQPATARSRPSLARAWQRTLRGIEHMSTTRANARAGLAADVFASCALLYLGLRRAELSPAFGISIALCGLILFSFVEYCFHRWLFHGSVQVLEQGHRKHHEEPQAHDSLPFFLPPFVATLLAGGLSIAVPASAALLFTGGMAAGYAAYGLTHTIFHTVRFRLPLARRWAAAHHIHHYHPHSNFGVTTPLWDILLKTRYLSGEKRLAS